MEDIDRDRFDDFDCRPGPSNGSVRLPDYLQRLISEKNVTAATTVDPGVPPSNES